MGLTLVTTGISGHNGAGPGKARNRGAGDREVSGQVGRMRARVSPRVHHPLEYSQVTF